MREKLLNASVLSLFKGREAKTPMKNVKRHERKLQQRILNISHSYLAFQRNTEERRVKKVGSE